MSKFTPGPWRFSGFSSPFGWLEGSDGETIWHVDDYGNTLPDEADARLIAAAPDLYDALSLLVAQLDRSNMAGLWTGMNAAREALIKAST